MPHNRTINDSGVRLAGDLFSFPAINDSGVIQLLNIIPYTLDEHGVIGYRTNTLALSHQPELTYGPGHPLAGQAIFAGYSDGDYHTRFGGVPMPFIDMDTIPPHALQQFLNLIQGIRDAILNAT